MYAGLGMPLNSSRYTTELRRELADRNRAYAAGRLHVESYGGDPVVVYAPEGPCHGNFFDPAYCAILARPDWNKRFRKIHTGGRSLPKLAEDPTRKWRELDSCMSSDALLMNIFCTPGVCESAAVQRMLGIDSEPLPTFGWKARVPLKSGLVDRTEVDMRWGDLLVEAKLTESDFQIREASLVEAYRDLDEVFDLDLLPRVMIRTRRRRQAVELPENFTQEWEAPCDDADQVARAFHAELEARADVEQPWLPAYAGYQLIRNVLAAHASGTAFCVIHDERRPDLRELWFDVMRAVRNAEMRVRCMTITWQELAPALPIPLRDFLNLKYGIVPPGEFPLAIEELEARIQGPHHAAVRK